MRSIYSVLSLFPLSVLVFVGCNDPPSSNGTSPLNNAMMDASQDADTSEDVETDRPSTDTAEDDSATQDTAETDAPVEELPPLCEGPTTFTDTVIHLYHLAHWIPAREPMEVVSIDRTGILLSHSRPEFPYNNMLSILFSTPFPERTDWNWPEVGDTVRVTAYECYAGTFTYGRLEDENLNLIWEGGSTVCTCENDGEGLPFQHLCQSQRYFAVDMSEPEAPCTVADMPIPDACDYRWTAWRANVRADVPVTLKTGESAEVMIQGRPFLAIAHLVGFNDCRCGSDCSQPVIALSLNPLRP